MISFSLTGKIGAPPRRAAIMSTVGGNNNILLGTGAELPDSAGANQIVLGTDKSSLLIQGSLNYRVGDSITSDKALEQPPAQFYLIEPPTTTYITITITLPAANLNKGVTVIFRRNNGNPATVVFASESNVYPFNGFGQGTVSLSINPPQIQTQFVCDGSAWYQIYAA